MFGAIFIIQGSFKAFSVRELLEFLNENDRKIQSQIVQESESHILNVNETEYVNYLVNEFIIDIPLINFESPSVTCFEKKISEYAFVYHLPYTGNSDLFQYAPSTRLIWTKEIFIEGMFAGLEGEYVCFEVMSIRKTSEDVKREAEKIIDNLKKQLEHLTHEVENYNAQLETKIKRKFEERKQSFLKKNHILASLGVPINKRENLPETYAIPPPRVRKKMFPKPVVSASEYKPEPVLDQSIYYDILQIIHEFGKVFERLPSTYKDKGEEELRDHLLLYLEPRYEGSATGETFNKSGKTDILIRYENSNVFIAECKFWQGQKIYLDTITQLLRYLTWRDSKAAVIVFVKNKDFSSVLKLVEDETPNHGNYLGYVNKEDESWFNYRFHLNGDTNREVKLAVLLFHIPPPMNSL